MISSTAALTSRVDDRSWPLVNESLDTTGIAALGPLLTAAECDSLIALYEQDDLFRSTIDMARHRFGQGEYRYFTYPLPPVIGELRGALWPHLLPIARDWAARLRQSAPWPDEFDEWIEMCHRGGQVRPTPLMLRYGAGDWNALHRDLYGDLVFPLQVVIGLNDPADDYTGGEFVVVEQRPRAQSRATTQTIPKGHAIVVTTRDRPVASARGWTAAPMRHGVSTVHGGSRHTIGLVFHDAA